MSKAMKDLLEGVVLVLVGLPLWLFTEDVDVPVVTLTKVGLVMLCVGGVLVATGLYRGVRESG
ncbi:DUF5708 family protein [Streptomyces sp. TRM68416]|uniref:DUF5708 family protein n=1 Tax=Streptomyces sp. TRM68416 TaxID=2758412 RepID=UPI001661C72E|nr:DUF5708 family protein [Streptomyces sp. TRM68416]MBD0843227.1 hypothetical protein [Streptomyces sp. TRM68416]